MSTGATILPDLSGTRLLRSLVPRPASRHCSSSPLLPARNLDCSYCFYLTATPIQSLIALLHDLRHARAPGRYLPFIYPIPSPSGELHPRCSRSSSKSSSSSSSTTAATGSPSPIRSRPTACSWTRLGAILPPRHQLLGVARWRREEQSTPTASTSRATVPGSVMESVELYNAIRSSSTFFACSVRPTFNGPGNSTGSIAASAWTTCKIHPGGVRPCRQSGGLCHHHEHYGRFLVELFGM